MVRRLVGTDNTRCEAMQPGPLLGNDAKRHPHFNSYFGSPPTAKRREPTPSNAEIVRVSRLIQFL